MGRQLGLFGLESQFLEFHQANPEVYEELRRLALQLLEAGRSRYGMMALINVVRWQRALHTKGDDYKINNNWAPYYSRLLAQHEPRLVGFFETRTADADRMLEET